MISRPRLPFAFAAVALVAVLAVLALPAAASASAPSAVTVDTYSSGAATATVEGSVDPAGEATQYQVQYGPASSDWCTSAGQSGSPADTTGLTDLGSIEPGSYAVSVDLTTDLTEGTDYCAQLIATNTSGEGDGGQVTWTQGAPFADTFDGYSTGNATATVEGDVNPAGQSTSYVVKYDLDSSDWCASGGDSGVPADATAPQILPAMDGTFHDVSVDLTGLTPGAGYCVEIVASNSAGSTSIDDGDQAFWTQPPPPPPPPWDLTVTASGNGTVVSSPAGIDCGAGSTCRADIPLGTQVTLTATPAAGSSFVGWLGITGCSSGAMCTFTLSAPTDVDARFNAVPGVRIHTFTVSRAGNGSGNVMSTPVGIDCGTICSTSLGTGTQVTLTATADFDATFTGWSGGGCTGTSTCTVTMNADTTVTATFTKKPSPPPKPTQCVVPKVKGKTLAAAKKAIKSHHCSVGKITRVESTKKNRGHVVAQSPKPGKHLKKGSRIGLKVGK